jgi:hypothetical protein
LWQKNNHQQGKNNHWQGKKATAEVKTKPAIIQNKNKTRHCLTYLKFSYLAAQTWFQDR